MSKTPEDTLPVLDAEGKPERKSKAKAILTDATKCIGCERCVQGCVQQNDLPPDFPARFRRKTVSLALATPRSWRYRGRPRTRPASYAASACTARIPPARRHAWSAH